MKMKQERKRGKRMRVTRKVMTRKVARRRNPDLQPIPDQQLQPKKWRSRIEIKSAKPWWQIFLILMLLENLLPRNLALNNLVPLELHLLLQLLEISQKKMSEDILKGDQ